MEHNENLVTKICNENTDPFSEMTQEEEEEEGDALTEERSEIIPTAMLTPPPTGEPLLNGSSRSSTSGNDLQQFTADELTQQSSVLSQNTDEGNSNQSANSDSADSKLIINEGSIDSNDISNTVDGRTLEASSTGVDINDDDVDNCKSTPLTEIESNQPDEIHAIVRHQETSQVIPEEKEDEEKEEEKEEEEDEEEVIPPVECASKDESENENEMHVLPPESLENTTENGEIVPSQSIINGIVCKNDDLTSTIDNGKENRLANETHTEHRKLKRKLSDSIFDPYETSQKQTKFNNQTNSIVLSDNQIAVDDSISNHLVNHDQINDSCDSSSNSDVQKSQDLPVAREKSQENADENFDSELEIENLLSVTKEKTIDECDHIYMNGHTSSKTELISSIDAPHKYNQQITFEPSNDLGKSNQSQLLKSKVKNPFSTPPQSETNSISDNGDEKSLDVQPEKLETNSQTNLSVEKSANDLTTNLMRIPIYIGNNSRTTMNISSNSDNNAPIANMPSDNQTVNLANEIVQQHKAPIITPQTQHDGKKMNTHIRIRRQVFLCSACGTYHEKWNLFYHIREVHNKFMCLFENCLKIFPNAERLVNHLESKHVHKPFVYEHKDDLLKSLPNQCFLMCCVCEHIFTEKDDVTAHSCETFMKPCSVCGLTFIHKSSCSALLSNKPSKHKQKRIAIAPTVTNATTCNSMSQQTFLRNALLGQESRINHYSDYQSAPNIAQIPITDRRLNNIPPHQIHSQHLPQSQPQHQHQPEHQHQNLQQHQLQPHFPFQSQQNSVSIALNTMNVLKYSAPQQCPISKLYMSKPEPQPNFFTSNLLPNNNADMYHANHMPYQNLPNGQYTQSQLDSRYPTANARFSRGMDTTTKPAFEHNERMERAPNQDHDNSNTESSSDSDDSNSDSSSDTDAEKEDKENSSKRVVKPFRINLTKNNMVERRESPHVDEQNESANEDDNIENENNLANNVNDNRSHQNMSDITNIQMQLDNIKQQMSAMQRIEESPTSLKVPKLKLKLTKPFQNPIESEQSSTESDSDSENENDEDENISHVQDNTPIESGSNETRMERDKISFSQSHGEVQQYPYNTNTSDCMSNTINNNNSFDDSLNESGSSAKNTSTDSGGNSACVEDDEYKIQTQQHVPPPIQDEHQQLNQMQITPEILSNQDQTMTQTNIALDNITNINVNENFYPTLEHNQNVMTPPDSILDGQAEMENDHQTGVTATVSELEHENREQEPIEVDLPQVVEDKRPITEFILDQPLDKIPIKSFIRKCLQFTYPNCLYCNHARSIAVNGVSLAEHLIGEHRFSATVDSITAEELLPETIEQKITTGLDELEETFFNMDSYDNKIMDPNYQYVKHFECFQCRFYSPIYKDLYLHNRKMHLRSALICLMCRSNFYSYSELVCHMCPGAQSKLIPIDLKFRCVLCNLDDIPSAFRLMVHLRKKHSACDVCLEECSDQSKLSCHVWKHKLHHLCYRCNITYRNKADITRHLFWKHGTESVMCKRCLEKKWPHVYHFCVPPISFKCEICNSTFSKALTLKVHKRSHNPESITFPCSIDDCEQKFISKKLMIKHVSLHYMPELPPPSDEKILLRETVENDSLIDKQGTNLENNSPSHSPSRNSSKQIEQEAPIDAVISVIEHDAREQEEKAKMLKKETTGPNESSSEQNHRNKPRKLKKNRSDFSDLLDLPTVNLSESDSSEDSDAESNTLQDPSAENSRHSLSALSASNETVTKFKSAQQTAFDDDDDKALMLEADIWENFKTYQANQMQDKALDSAEEEERVVAENPVLLHVSQSDHDYPMMYKPLVKKSKVSSVEHIPSFEPIIEENERGDIKITFIEAPESPAGNLDAQSPTPLPTSTVTITDEEIPKTEDEKVVCDTDENLDTDKKDSKKVKADRSDRKADESDSSSDSSDSDSSCSCGSNCSCSSSGSSSSSSSDSGSDSSSSEGKRKKVLTKTKTPERTTPERNVAVADVEQNVEPMKQEILDEPIIAPKTEIGNENEAQQDESETIDVGKPDLDVVDVVTTDKKFTQPDIYTMVVESDLETTDSETDEEFYDEHPQKLAIQMLAEKRQQLMLQTLNPVNGMPYIPATPLLSEELPKGSKTRTKKRRRTHKNTRSPQKQLLTNIPKSNPNGLHQTSNNSSLVEKSLERNAFSAITSASVTIPKSTPFTIQSNHPFMESQIDTSPQINQNINVLATGASTPAISSFDNLPNIPATLPSKQHLMRLSTSSASDADNSLKRSKRRRIPNKFYGYTSDDDSMSAASTLNSSYQNPFKPTPPPNLTWSKEDLPRPSKNNRAGTLKKILRLSSKSSKSPMQRKLPLKGAMKTAGMKNRTIAKIKEKMRMTSTPTVPKIIIRGIPRPNQPKVQHNTFLAPDLIDASHVPNVPVHHMSPPKVNKELYDQSSDSDSDINLQINQASRRTIETSLNDEYNRDKMMRTQPQKHQMPFIRPDHTLLPLKRPSPSPPPAPPTFVGQHHSQNEHLPSNLLSTMQQPIFNGVQHKSKQESTRNDSNLYCYCRRTYDEMSEMIACDAQDCSIEWFHFECVGIKVTDINPQDKWFCPKCKERNARNSYMASNNVNNTNSNRFTPASLDLA